MTRLISEHFVGAAPVWTAIGTADVSLSEVRDASHSLLPKCQNPQCQARRFDPLLGYCRLCEYEMHVWGEVAALEAAGDPEGAMVAQHLRTADYPKPETTKRVVRAKRAAERRTAV